MNLAEFRRQVWLECTPVRLLMLPLVLALLFFTARYGFLRSDQGFAVMILTVFFVVAGVWGAGLVSASVTDEAAGLTWDWQRLSSQRPMELVVGKLFGSPVMAWYGGGWCLAVYLFAALGPDPGQAVFVLALAVIGTLLLHALALLLELIVPPESRGTRRRRSPLGWLLLAVVSLQIWMSGFGLASGSLGPARWFGMDWDARAFLLMSASIWFGWAVLACRQRTAALLRHPTTPLSWMVFLAWCWIYTAGFQAPPAMLARYGARVPLFFLNVWAWPALAVLALTATLAFLEDKSATSWRLWLAAVRQGDRRRVWQRMPRWLAGLPVVLGAQIYVWLTMPAAHAFVGWWLLGLTLQLTRDLAVQRALHWNGGKGRPQLAFAVYLLVVYLLLPNLVQPLRQALLATAGGDPVSVLLLALQAAAALGLCVWRWRRHYAMHV